MSRTPPPSDSLWANDDDDPRIEARFRKFHAEHPEVYRLFAQFAWELVNAGWERGSADMICHRIRWETTVNRERAGGFKINDHFTSRYARMLACDESRFAGFFVFRRLKDDAKGGG